MRLLIVGAGFAGAVHARELAEAGYSVTVIDKRTHIAGNCYDYIDNTGVRVHAYGPHLFHTNNQTVVDWISKFTDWIPYEHKVVAWLPDGSLVPMPVNRQTISKVFKRSLNNEAEVVELLSSVSKTPPGKIGTAEDHLYSTIGETLTNLFFRPYTKKMWDMDLSEMDAAVVQRLQIRTDDENRYFPKDKFQAMPKHGYTNLFQSIFNHENIKISLNTTFNKSMLDEYSYCFNSMPIDEYFDKCFGELPYRSIKFHLDREEVEQAPKHVTINYTHSGPLTRETWWHNIPGHHIEKTHEVVVTREQPCDYRDNNFERYYPVKTHDGRYDALYKKYKALADDYTNIEFIGRCGTYQYLDMHQVINQSLRNVQKWIGERK